MYAVPFAVFVNEENENKNVCVSLSLKIKGAIRCKDYFIFKYSNINEVLHESLYKTQNSQLSTASNGFNCLNSRFEIDDIVAYICPPIDQPSGNYRQLIKNMSPTVRGGL